MRKTFLITLKWMAILTLSVVISGCVEDPTKNWKPTKIIIGKQILCAEDFYKNK